ncbi:MAG: nodulation protein NfeD [Deltaproteobacteria bacterium]|nr:nodulation protein NfeD [Deltaproteobacteria bacterium]
MIKMRKWGRKVSRAALLVAMLGMLVGLVGNVLADGDPVAESNKPQSTPAIDKKAKAEAQSAPDSSEKWGDRQAKIAVIEIKGGIFAGTAEYVANAVERAEREKYQCLLIEIDTPGGALDETQEIVKSMLSARVPIVVFVTPKGAQAASAGTFITMAGHVAAMAPGTRIGAAHPVSISLIPSTPGDDEEDKEKKKKSADQAAIMNEKVTNDTVSFIQGIAKERGRNAEWAEKAVRESVSITSDEAVKIKVIDLEAENLDDLLELIDGRQIKLEKKTTATLHTKGAKIDRWEKSLKQRLLGALGNPNLLMILFLVGLGGIAMEFYHPGAIVPGVVGALFLLLAMISMQILPVSLGGLLLVLAGIGLMIAEAFVVSYGLLAIGGGVLLVLGGIMLVDPSSQPYYMDPTMQVDWTVLIPTVVVLGAGLILIGYKVVSTQRKKIKTGIEGMDGLVGDARSEINKEGGMVFVRGENWKAVSQEVIPKGSRVEVVSLDGLLLHVKIKD